VPYGVKIFIAGSLLFTGLSIVRIYETGCTPTPTPTIPMTRKMFAWQNIRNEILTTMVDIFGGLGAFMFATGSVFYLPEVGTDVIYSWIAWALFQTGSAMYIISACIVVYRLFALVW
jgi:hypothetical protein